ncbi:hypothetical protein KAH55_09270, partial [bacterium]|nr:hypothetical protein [bacterium]
AEAPVEFMDYYFMHLDSTGSRVVYDRNIDTSNVIFKKITSYKIPVDSTYRKIYQLAGQMCFEYGTYQMEHGKFKFAKKYLEASCSIEWPERFLALYKLARFYSVRANPKAAISKCYDIALMHDALNQRQVKEYLSLLVRLFRNRKIRQREVAREIYQIYTVYNEGGRIPWDTIYRYLEPYHSY